MNASLTSARESNSPRFLLFLICLFASAGQLAIDIYVPALPDMARSFATTPQAIQSSVSGYMAAYALGQLIFGPIAPCRRFHSARSTSPATRSTVSGSKPSAMMSSRPSRCPT